MKEDEKLLPLGEPTLHFYPPPTTPNVQRPGVPSKEAQQWGVVISIIIIVLMIVIGAFYAWGKRISQNQYPAAVTE